MLTNGNITIFHYDENNCTYKPKQYNGVSVHKYAAVKGSENGIVTDNLCKIRIPTIKDVNISTDDYIFLGLTSGKIDKSKCLKVFAFSDNRRGALKHWRIDCK